MAGAASPSILDSLNKLKRLSLGIPLLILMMLFMTILPLPPFLLDILFSFNITLSLIILMVSLYVRRPLEFSLFPTILLVTTLLRLTLNIASTRVVMLHGHEGPHAAGAVIHAFGEVVIGGNFFVGIIVFTILVIINFVVVTKGAGRISEVSARFTLDAMPGKQMAVDADLNAGVITQEEAKIRRKEITDEADFYGAMDGASKFVRGDAVAGLLILFINLIGGVSIAVFQHGMNIALAFQNFSILTIGDGLVAQIPGLLLSISAAIMVTRVASEQDIASQTSSQLFEDPKPIFIATGVLTVLALIPGMPHFAFLSIAAIGGFAGYLILNKDKNTPDTENDKLKKATETLAEKELDWDDVVPVDRVELEIGYRLITLVGTQKDGILISRIKGIRKKLSQELGFLIPSVHIRDNLDLPPSHYRILLMGVNVAEAEIFPDKFMAINPGHINAPIQGIATKDPSFGLDAIWVDQANKDYAQSLGFTVVDASTVMATHLNQVLIQYAGDLFGHEEAQQLLDRLSKLAPKLVESLNSPAHGLPLSQVVRVLQELLRNHIPLVDIRTIAEKLIEHAKVPDTDELIELVRMSLKRLIIQNICGNTTEIPVAILDHELAQILHKSIQKENSGNERKVLNIEPGLAEKLITRLLEYIQQCDVQAKPSILMVSPDLRPLLEKLMRPNLPTLHILSHQEIPDSKRVNIIAKVG